jgi:predicted lipoprotein with Yx(FWY)xxD motif
MAALGHRNGGDSRNPGGWNAAGTERVPARGARRVWGRAVAGTLSAAGLAAASLSLALVLAVPGGTASASSSKPKTIKVSTAKVPGVGTVLTTASGLTLYRFTEDKPGKSVCTGACAKIWPPLLASKGAHVSGPKGVKGLAVMKVGNGHFQVVFHKIPLYRFDGDKAKGQATGQNVGKVWFAALKSGIPASNAAPTTAATPTAPTTPSAPTTAGAGTSTTQPATPMTPTTQVPGSSSTPAPAVTPTTRAPSPPPTTTPPTQPKPPPTTTTTAAPISGGTGF